MSTTASVAASVSRLTRLGAVAVVLGVLVSFLGGVWDIHWHTDVGPDTFFTAPHLLLYAGAATVGVSSLVVVLLCTERAGRPDVKAEPAAVPILWRTFRAPLGFVVSGSGAALFLLAGLYDQWWHGLYGFDAVLDSPPHSALGLGDVTALSGAALVCALFVARSPSRLPLVGLATVAAAFLANAASWQLSVPADLAGVNGQLVFLGLLYPLVMAAVVSVTRRPWGATVTGLAMTVLVAASWAFSDWATPAYADAIGLYPRDDAYGFPVILAVLPKFVLPAGLLMDALLRLARQRAAPVRPAVRVVGAFSAVALVLPEVLWRTGATQAPVSRPVVTVLLAAATGAVGAWTGWKLGVVLRRLATGPVVSDRPARPPRAGRRAGAVAAASLAVVVLAGAPVVAAPAVWVVHWETVTAGPYDVQVGFSEWPVTADRSLDIVFLPDSGISDKEGTVTLMAPSGAQDERRLVRHPRMREAWGWTSSPSPRRGGGSCAWTWTDPRAVGPAPPRRPCSRGRVPRSP